MFISCFCFQFILFCFLFVCENSTGRWKSHKYKSYIRVEQWRQKCTPYEIASSEQSIAWQSGIKWIRTYTWRRLYVFDGIRTRQRWVYIISQYVAFHIINSILKGQLSVERQSIKWKVLSNYSKLLWNIENIKCDTYLKAIAASNHRIRSQPKNNNYVDVELIFD